MSSRRGNRSFVSRRKKAKEATKTPVEEPARPALRLPGGLWWLTRRAHGHWLPSALGLTFVRLSALQGEGAAGPGPGPAFPSARDCDHGHAFLSCICPTSLIIRGCLGQALRARSKPEDLFPRLCGPADVPLPFRVLVFFSVKWG